MCERAVAAVAHSFVNSRLSHYDRLRLRIRANSESNCEISWEIVKFGEKSWTFERNYEILRAIVKFWEKSWTFERNCEILRAIVRFREIWCECAHFYACVMCVYVYVWVMSHEWVMCMYESCHMNESCHTCEWALCAWECACNLFKHVSAFCYNI